MSVGAATVRGCGAGRPVTAFVGFRRYNVDDPT
jgi:hypothetical protein